MRLADYLNAQEIKPAEFARRIGTTRQAIGRYMRGERMPEVHILGAIKTATAGAVTADDFAEHVAKANAESHQNGEAA